LKRKGNEGISFKRGKIGILRRNESGFTLIELIIIIVVIGILTTIAVTRFQDITEDAAVAATKGNLASIRGAIALIHAKILIAGVSASNTEFPTIVEMNNNRTSSTRPVSVRDLKLLDGPSGSNCQNPNVCMPESTISPLGTLAQRSLVVAVTAADADARSVSGSSGWAYSPDGGDFYTNQVLPADGKGITANRW
jgi:prepilin-type N-terminal cleavage/methylation domain-containing protein